jgi:hypothetical protein
MPKMLFPVRTFTTKLQPQYNTIANRNNHFLTINKMHSIKLHPQNIRTMTTNIETLKTNIELFAGIMGFCGLIGCVIGGGHTLIERDFYIENCFPSVAYTEYSKQYKHDSTDVPKKILNTITIVSIVSSGAISGFICGALVTPLIPFIVVYMIFKKPKKSLFP